MKFTRAVDMTADSALKRALSTLLSSLLLTLGLVMVGTAPASADNVPLPDGYYLCHATTNADSPEEVKNWVTNTPSSSGDAEGHFGTGHQNGMDIIPPIPGDPILSEGQNWTEYGQTVHDLGCVVPVTVSVTFTDNACVDGDFVAPAVDAPDFKGTQHTISGDVAPGSTVTVTYTAKEGYGIDGQSAFTHTFPAEPSASAYCNQPVAQTVHDSKTGCDLSSFGDFEAGTIRRTGTREYVWNSTTREWELEPESGIAWGPWTQAGADVYGDAEYFANCAPDQPESVTVSDSQTGCDLSSFGDFEAGTIRRSGTREYVWNSTTREWELEPESGIAWGPWTQAAADVYGDAEYFDNCAPDQPTAKTVSDSVSECSLVAYGDFEPGTIRRTGTQEYVWNSTTREWELEPDSGIAWGPWTQVDADVYTDTEYEQLCAGERPPAEPVEDSVTNCDLSAYGDFEPGTVTRTGEQEYVWSSTERRWVLESEADITWGDWTQSTGDAYTNEEYFENCAPPQPDSEDVHESQTACDLSVYGDFGAGTITRTGEREYIWNATSRTWELEPMAAVAWGPWTQAAGDVYDDVEYFENCAPTQPPAETVPDSRTSCDLSSFGAFEAGTITRIGNREYVWSSATRQWVLEPESGIAWGDWTQAAGDVYDDAEYFENCAPPQPEPEPVDDSATGCDLSGYGDFAAGTITRTGERAYVWNAMTRQWELESEVDIDWGDWTQTDGDAYTDEEYFAECAPEQPDPESRETAGEKESCNLGGVRTWTDTFTTEYVWDLQLREWVLGEESGPVRSDEEFTPYTLVQLATLCPPDIAGEQEVVHHHTLPEVEGVQASVPTAVDAGIGQPDPLVNHRLPLGLLAMGGGLCLMGVTGWRRRATATR